MGIWGVVIYLFILVRHARHRRGRCILTAKTLVHWEDVLCAELNENMQGGGRSLRKALCVLVEGLDSRAP